jgi:phosphorylcholine metabolism protein LicD
MSPVAFAYETLTFTLRAEQILKTFECKVLTVIPEANRDVAKEEWRKLHHKEIYNILFSTRTISRANKYQRMRLG